MGNSRGQSILEYVIVLTVIVAAVLVGALVFAPQDKSKGVGKLMDKAGGTIENAATDMASKIKIK